ncbi:MAG: ATP-binding protein [bacterium]
MNSGLEVKDKSSELNRIIWFGCMLSFFFWIFESSLNAFVFQKGTFLSQLFSLHLHQIWVRITVMGILALMVLYTYFILKMGRGKDQTLNRALEKAFEKSGDGMCVIDTNFTIQNVNPTFSYVAGMRKKRIEGRKCYEVLPLSVCNTAQCPIKKDLKGENCLEYDVERLGRDGTKKIPCRMKIIPLRDAHGQLKGIIESFPSMARIPDNHAPFNRSASLHPPMDELAREQAEIKDLKEQIEFVLGVTKTGLHILDSDLNIQYLDPAWKKVYGDPGTKKCYEYFMGRTTICPECVALHALEKKSVIISEEILVKENNRPIQVSTIPFQNDKGEWVVAQIKIDITELKKAEHEKQEIQAQLHQAQKLEPVGRLAGGVAHDFNNILTTIMGYTELLLSNLKDRPQLHLYAENIKKAGKIASNLTRQLLAFSRGQILKPRVLDLKMRLHDLENMFRHTIGEDIELYTSFEPNLAQVKADPGQIDQVILNLVVNARDAMPDGGKIHIKTKNVIMKEDCQKEIPHAKPGKFVCLTVEDTGSGMSKDTINRIFEPFFTTKRQGKGSGLGLSTVFGIVTQHGGWINVYSEPGKGSTFEVYLPAFFLEAEEPDREEVIVKDYKGHGEHILVVEDDKSLKEFISKILRKNGYVPFTAENAKEALEIFKTHKKNLQLVFSDVVLPHGTGVTLVDTMLQEKPDLSVLLTSGYIDQKSQWHIIQKRGLQFLPKPFDGSALLQAIREVLKNN